MTNVVSIEEAVNKRWDEYVALQRKAQETCSVADGVACGRAWRRWLDLFMSEEQRKSIGEVAS